MDGPPLYTLEPFLEHFMERRLQTSTKHEKAFDQEKERKKWCNGWQLQSKRTNERDRCPMNALRRQNKIPLKFYVLL